jgi:hypothetical protein
MCNILLVSCFLKKSSISKEINSPENKKKAKKSKE